ncbi:hypothetical protein AK88_05201 [Plasmodium fragile]|uniref:Schizont-infected cell agglutination C-terminal domain-containing protein n=1 Tax=Plasmodium fragile TaxID=5857 RepID=A0A0D9QDT1_PLAFR|nr:uncharacterized protein AK88_05201 [Plasmodium fragile]KJP85158.1 hypothetical protein AK88_05201 [Plasmodium fragile]
MHEFVNYMDGDDMISYAANCDNTGWEHPHGSPGHRYVGHTVGDTIVCVLMVGALFFMNGWSLQERDRHKEDDINETIREHLLCAIVHMFSEVLNESVCPSPRGTFYAWYSMGKMGDGRGGWGDGLIKEGICGRAVVAHGKVGHIELNAEVKKWLQGNSALQNRIQQVKGTNTCRTPWQKEWRIEKFLNSENMGDTTGSQIFQIVHDLKQGMTDIFREIREEVDESIEQREQARKKNFANDGKSGEPATKAATTPSPQEPKRKQPADAGGGDQNGAKPSSPSSSPAGESGTGSTGGPQPQPPSGGPPVGRADTAPADTLPQPPPAAPAGGTHAGQGPATSTGTGPGQQPPPPPPPPGPPPSPPTPTKEGTDAQSPPSKADSSPEGTSQGKGKILRDSKKKPEENKAKCSEDETDHAKLFDCLQRQEDLANAGTGVNQPDGSEKYDGHGPVGLPDSSRTITISEGTSPEVSTVPPGNAVIDGGNDDPPPPNPRASCSPDDFDLSSGFGGGTPQHCTKGANSTTSSSSTCSCSGSKRKEAVAGGGSTAGGPISITGGTQNGPTSGSTQPAPFPFDPVNIFTQDIENVAGGFAPPTTTHGSSGSSNMDHGGPGGPIPPDLTNDVLIATTPILFFLASVTVALLGYSLWKYFAYLGKNRRRTYRTVRDVPSPPLDEEILQHLQRGELPPPAYWYTMVRDRQPGRLPGARRRRPPRVHTRTIIELHLEVLNECEATEWKSVKDDYWQIVVEAFAHDLEPAATGHSSFPDAPTPNQGLPRHTVSSALHPPTDIDGIDPCLPNEDNPWKCMENIQFETDPCPPNEHDPDPWSCMETIQLATDRSPPNADDPWSCMETIQLDDEQNRPSDHGHHTAARTHWINWIERHKHLFRECTTQPWFLQLKSNWTQHVREHMVANADNVVYGHSELGEAATMESTKLWLWKEWVAQQHDLINTYGEQEWFQHLLNNVQQQTASHKGEVPGVEEDFEVENVMGTEDMLRVRDVPRSQPLHEQYYNKKQVIAKLWMLLLASVIEECELESRLQQKELYVDALLQQL